MSERTDKPLSPVSLRTVSLDNGATLEVLDASRVMVGDRWQVAALFRMTIPVAETIAAGETGGIDPEDARRRLGGTVVFEKRMERTFIANEEKQACLDGLVQRYLEGNLAYLQRPVFARNVLRRRYAEARRQAEWQSKQSGD